ncbi:MAG: MFS transporter [Armatimonadota bacterium]|nr:MFS transporter [Armatimonadota bacterium]MDR7426950.1 MFS transporter [Armatimonadota bacterium]MDR7470636.1 MFS transporter [Armatimonadota bacterium]
MTDALGTATLELGGLRDRARRITLTLFITQSLGSAATIAIFPIVAIIGARLSGRVAWAGVPATCYLLGSALSAFLWGQVMDRRGRRPALLAGTSTGAAGAALAGAATIGGSFAVFLLGSLLIGSATAAVQLARFVAAEVHPPQERGRAIARVVLGGTVGAVAGPLLAGPMAGLAGRAGVDELAGPYGATLALFALAAAVIFVWLRPEPRDLARHLGSPSLRSAATGAPGRPILEILRQRPALLAVLAMAFGQLTMVMLMVITPLHMRNHQHPLTHISFVVSAHVVGMYLFSVVSGRLADRWGRSPVIATGAGVLTLAALAAPRSPEVVPLAAALFLVGLGWNFCFVGGSSLLADQLSPEERGRAQGFNDLLIGLSSAGGSFGSGLVFAAVGYATMGLAAAGVALTLLALTLWGRFGRRRAFAPSP